MLASKAEILARYSKSEKLSDSVGRLISVVNLKFSEKLAVRRLAETEDEMVLAFMSVAASVREIDGIAFPFPRTRAELNSTIDILDEEGMAAAMEASMKLRGPIGEAGSEDAAKKSQETPASGSSAS